MTYSPILFGLVHDDKSLQHAIKAIDEMKKRGIKKVGFEIGLSKRDITWLSERTLEPIRASGIDDFIKGMAFLNFPLSDDYFSKLREHAEKIGIQTVTIDSPKAHRVAGVLEFCNNLLGEHPHRKLFEDYISITARDSFMEKSIEKHKPDAVVCGLGHSFSIAKKFRIPLKNISFINEKGVFRPKHSLAEAKFLAEVYKQHARKLRQIKVDRKKIGKIRFGKLQVQIAK